MAAPPFPYETRLNILHQPLEVIDEKALADGCEFQWYNQTLCQVNGSVVRLGVIQGEYHWHQHDADDEFFYVVEGQLLIDLEGVMHRTRAPQRTVILMVENAGIIPTGN
jgi:mannose-6-phosphate isomerase-like protein (cupin superfamily)